MFFKRLGQFTARYRYLIVLLWVAAAIGITLAAPPLNDVLTTEMARFLPENAPYIEAYQVFTETFPDEDAAASVVVVFDAAEAGGVLNREAEDFAEQIDTPAARFIAEFADWLKSDERPENVVRVIAPTDAAEVASMTVGQDNEVAIVNVKLASNDADDQTSTILREWLDEHNPGNVKTYQTGLYAIGRTTSDTAIETVDRTIWVTVALVVFLLLLIYRSPVSPLVPLLTVTIVYLIVAGIVGFIAASGVVISTYANVMLVVVLYGAGTDYCLFLISRFREEMADVHNVPEAVSHTIERVGETIASSAGTIFVGFMALAFAEMGLYKTSGPALAIGILVMLVAGLTLAPALLAILGDYAFWPGKAKHRVTGKFYEQVSKLVSSRPVLTVILISAIMAPFAIHGLTAPASYDLLADLPDDAEPAIGFNRLQSSLGAGNMAPLEVIVTGRDPERLAADIMNLSAELSAIRGVADIRSLNNPLGQGGTIRDLLLVKSQLNLIGDMLESGMPGGEMTLAQMLQGVGALNMYINLLAERFPEVADDPNLTTLQSILSNPLQLALRQGEIAPAFSGLASRFESMEEAYLLPTELEPLLAAAPEGENGGFAGQFAQLTSMYLADEGTTFRLTVILNESPDSFAAMDTVKEIRTVLDRYRDSGEAVVYGQTVITTDIRDTIERDLIRAIGFVILGIFIVLLLMLRSVIAPLYLIATVALSFAFTLGLTDVLFRAVAGVQGLTWYMPFFTFVFLVALGVDYSIFLIGRVKEEVPRHGTREGVHRAVAATGAIITSAGIILAGTFAALMTGTIMGLVELGFAVAVGVLIDTFVIRTMLVPALTVLFGRWAWWPGHLTKIVKDDAMPVAPAGSAS